MHQVLLPCTPALFMTSLIQTATILPTLMCPFLTNTDSLHHYEHQAWQGQYRLDICTSCMLVIGRLGICTSCMLVIGRLSICTSCMMVIGRLSICTSCMLVIGRLNVCTSCMLVIGRLSICTSCMLVIGRLSICTSCMLVIGRLNVCTSCMLVIGRLSMIGRLSICTSCMLVIGRLDICTSRMLIISRFVKAKLDNFKILKTCWVQGLHQVSEDSTAVGVQGTALAVKGQHCCRGRGDCISSQGTALL